MTWSKTTPVGTETLKLGDDRLRGLKVDFTLGMDWEHVIPGSDINNPIADHKFYIGSAAPSDGYNIKGRIYYNTITQAFYCYSGTAWVPVNMPRNLFPTGTRLPAENLGSSWKTITLGTRYAIRLRDYKDGLVTGGVDDPLLFTNSHETDSVAYLHSHAVSGTISGLDGTKIGRGGSASTTPYPVNWDHTHPFSATSQQSLITHSHTLLENGMSISARVLAIYERV